MWDDKLIVDMFTLYFCAIFLLGASLTAGVFLLVALLF